MTRAIRPRGMNMAADVLAGGEAESVRFRRLEDGAINNPKVERYALLLADEVPATIAWRQVGYADDTGRARDWRKRVERDPVFQERVRELMGEKSVQDQSGSPFADARWTARQMWREARAVGDLREAGRASELLFKIAERELEWVKIEGIDSPAAPVASRGPGRPAVELEVTKASTPSEHMSRMLVRPRGEAAA